MNLQAFSSEYEDQFVLRLQAETSVRYAAQTVALVGFMGAGKSTVGRELAHIIGRPFLDTDLMVEARTGRKVAELFAVGERVFRLLEAEAVAEAMSAGPCVVALGGGAVTNTHTRGLLLTAALVVHIHIDWPVFRAILPVIREERPLLKGRSIGEIHALYLQRMTSYRHAHLRFTVPRTDPTDAAGVLARILADRWRMDPPRDE